MNTEILKDFVQRGQAAQAAVDEILQEETMTDEERFSELERKYHRQAGQIENLRVMLRATLKALMHSPAEDEDRDFYELFHQMANKRS
ncbi:MAG: hypothetical protein AAGJ80_13775 [Cyanobacteria bacterium J06553_1]